MMRFDIVFGLLCSIGLIVGGLYIIVTQSASFRTGLVITGNGAIAIGMVLTLGGCYSGYTFIGVIKRVMNDENDKKM